MSIFPEFFRRKDPQQQMEKKVNKSWNDHLRYKESDTRIYREIEEFITQQLHILSSLRENLTNGIGDWQEALEFRPVLKKTAQLIKKTKLLLLEDKKDILKRLNLLEKELGYLEVSVIPDFPSYPQMNRYGYSTGTNSPHFQSENESTNSAKQKRVDTSRALIGIETEMSHILNILNERTN